MAFVDFRTQLYNKCQTLLFVTHAPHPTALGAAQRPVTTKYDLYPDGAIILYKGLIHICGGQTLERRSDSWRALLRFAQARTCDADSPKMRMLWWRPSWFTIAYIGIVMNEQCITCRRRRDRHVPAGRSISHRKPG
jgi:hypothetical protein